MKIIIKIIISIFTFISLVFAIYGVFFGSDWMKNGPSFGTDYFIHVVINLLFFYYMMLFAIYMFPIYSIYNYNNINYYKRKINIAYEIISLVFIALFIKGFFINIALYPEYHFKFDEGLFHLIRSFMIGFLFYLAAMEDWGQSFT